MNSILLYVILFLMVVAAIMTIITTRLFTAVIYSSALSAFAALVYVLLGAPDVALAEAVIGSTLATIIFLVTLKKYRIFTVYLIGKRDDSQLASGLQLLTKTLQRYDIEPHILQSSASADELLSDPHCDLVAERKDDIVIFYGQQSVHFSRIAEDFSEQINAGKFIFKYDLENSSTDSKGVSHHDI